MTTTTTAPVTVDGIHHAFKTTASSTSVVTTTAVSTDTAGDKAVHTTVTTPVTNKTMVSSVYYGSSASPKTGDSRSIIGVLAVGVTAGVLAIITKRHKR